MKPEGESYLKISTTSVYASFDLNWVITIPYNDKNTQSGGRKVGGRIGRTDTHYSYVPSWLRQHG